VRFDTIAILDWSGGNDRGPTPKKDAIWVAVCRGGVVMPPVYLRNRAVAFDWLADLCESEIAAGRRLLAGFDFPFGYPAGFAAHLVGRADPLALWDWLAQRLDDRPEGNNRFALAGQINGMFPGVGPFWYNGAAADVLHLPRKGNDRTFDGFPERRLAETCAKGAFTCWQLGGAGAVGGQAITGMAALSRLRARFVDAVRVWPFQPLDGSIALVEVWPSLIDGAVRAQQETGEIRDRAQVRVLARTLWAMQDAGDLAAALGDVPDQARAEEGWILGLGHEDRMQNAAQGRRPAKAPPETRVQGLSNDCFALPPGVRWTPVDEALALLRDRLRPVVAPEPWRATLPTGVSLPAITWRCVAIRRVPMRLLMDTGFAMARCCRAPRGCRLSRGGQRPVRRSLAQCHRARPCASSPARWCHRGWIPW